jgi:hypothetical protein
MIIGGASDTRGGEEAQLQASANAIAVRFMVMSKQDCRRAARELKVDSAVPAGTPPPCATESQYVVYHSTSE